MFSPKSKFEFYGDFTKYKNIENGKEVWFSFNGFNELVTILEATEDKLVIETSSEVANKLKV